MTDPREWLERALCRSMGPAQFFAESRDNRCYDAVKTLCKRCPVRAECLDSCMEQEPVLSQEYGLWGGLTPKERRRVTRYAVVRTPGNQGTIDT
jgi:WhiB family redox-sensing transcriptional regulator